MAKSLTGSLSWSNQALKSHLPRIENAAPHRREEDYASARALYVNVSEPWLIAPLPSSRTCRKVSVVQRLSGAAPYPLGRTDPAP